MIARAQGSDARHNRANRYGSRAPRVPPGPRAHTATTVAARAIRGVLRPRRSQRRAGAVEPLVGTLTEDAHRLALDVLGVEEVDGPAALVRQAGQHLPIHDGIGAAL